MVNDYAREQHMRRSRLPSLFRCQAIQLGPISAPNFHFSFSGILFRGKKRKPAVQSTRVLSFITILLLVEPLSDILLARHLLVTPSASHLFSQIF